MQKTEMTGDVQGFELPRGCFFTSVVILMMITTFAAALIGVLY
ncbi:hypothetical protein [Yoonia litorea]|uniref:Uncharacterized protein n=1 Tax=Yoonia litorea TaxID=1123755 RepID=A0A1I6N1M1_9RHOB|nr:hypothetical protein [Yoonia litorea]SFS21865.1 hypothetical protein SAMN05444714_2985 [Yoonia litorea]